MDNRDFINNEIAATIVGKYFNPRTAILVEFRPCMYLIVGQSLIHTKTAHKPQIRAFGVNPKSIFFEVHTSVCGLNRSEFNQDFSHENEKIFSNNCGCNFVLYEIAIFQIVTLQGKLNRAGDLQISKLGKNFFSKVYLYDVRDNPPNDLGLITPKCIF